MVQLRVITFLFMVVAVCAMVVKPAMALSIIRDTEIEQTLKDWSEPIFKQAGLSKDQVNIILIGQNDINAFVAGGSNIFIYTGLIRAADYPEELLGVIAHETGHITGGHLIASRRAMEKASYQSILATVLGVGAAIATGDGGAAAVVGAGGSGLAQKGYLSHSRIQESSADQASYKFLKSAGINPYGSVSFLEKLEGQELLPASQQSEYMRTHPLTRNRVDAMRELANKSGADKNLGQSDYQDTFDLIKAKIIAFESPNSVPRFYPNPKDSTPAAYAHAIMNYRNHRFDKAVTMMDQLIKSDPNYAPFYEMKGQVLTDKGDLDGAITAYQKSLDLYQYDAPLVQTSLAHLYVEQDKSLDKAASLLETALETDRKNATAYRLLATIKGRQGHETDAQYYLAEEATIQGRIGDAKQFMKQIDHQGDLSASLSLAYNDLKHYIEGLPRPDK